MALEIVLLVKRFRPELSKEPFYQEYQIPYTEDMVVLDALNYINDEVDSTLAHRWSCRMGICGSCGAMINGTPRLACATFLRQLTRGIVEVEPLDHFPVIKDLVVDMEDFMQKLAEVMPWLIREKIKPLDRGEYFQTPGQIRLYGQQSMCINCLICYSACPVYGLDSEFLGPAAIALAYRYNMDSRDQGREKRLSRLVGKSGVWDCTYVGECSVVCPKDVDPAGAIQRLKFPGSLHVLKTLLPRL
ncbi:MAG: succinate dehydrogenase iron-sulfur subunit [Candidatus Thermoplasmatota archaeon]|nr:succinate dehydrogenase iron-sulfur subunit [Candidatus Thermoplasmatota archaeon]